MTNFKKRSFLIVNGKIIKIELDKRFKDLEADHGELKILLI